MNNNFKKNILFVIFPIFIFLGLLGAYTFVDGFLQAVSNKIYYLIVLFFTVTSGYNTFVISRLNSLGNLDDIRVKDAVLIRKEMLSIREPLDTVIPFSIYCAGILLFSSFLVDFSPNTYIFIAIFSSFTIAVGVFLLNIITYANKRITTLKNKVDNLVSIEKKRQALLLEMREQAENDPFSSMDLHFSKHKNIIHS